MLSHSEPVVPLLAERGGEQGVEGERPDSPGPAPADSASQRQQGTKTRAQHRENNFWHTLSSRFETLLFEVYQ